jgi:hypothetical protein
VADGDATSPTLANPCTAYDRRILSFYAISLLLSKCHSGLLSPGWSLTRLRTLNAVRTQIQNPDALALLRPFQMGQAGAAVSADVNGGVRTDYIN